MIKKIKIEDVTSSFYYDELRDWILSTTYHQVNDVSIDVIIKKAVDVYNRMRRYIHSLTGRYYDPFFNLEKELDYIFNKGAVIGVILYIAELQNDYFTSSLLDLQIKDYIPLMNYSMLVEIINCMKLEKVESNKPSQQQPNITSPKPTNKLPEFFNSKLRNSEAATKQFMELLRKCCKSIGKRNGKTWGHVRQALINIGLIDAYSAKMTLAQTIADICPNTTKSSVNQSIKRFCHMYCINNSITDDNIIADIAKQFQPVLDAIKP